VAFPTFGPVHLAILAAVLLVAGALAAVARRHPRAATPIRLALAATIAADELAWYAHSVANGWVRPPRGLPLDLCDVVLWLTVLALVTRRQWVLEVVYFLGLAGSGMALLTPDVSAAFPSYVATKFFVAHGGVVAAILYLVFTGALRPRPGAWWRVFLYVNVYAAVIALFNARYGTNYMYLREKPQAGSLLDLLGPWPWYILVLEAIGAVAFVLVYLPYAIGDRLRGAGGAAETGMA
jgi:hypothetical integral membrane protein (TIGR02206 family)